MIGGTYEMYSATVERDMTASKAVVDAMLRSAKAAQRTAVKQSALVGILRVGWI